MARLISSWSFSILATQESHVYHSLRRCLAFDELCVGASPSFHCVVNNRFGSY
jgi:hypothetical protein